MQKPGRKVWAFCIKESPHHLDSSAYPLKNILRPWGVKPAKL